VSLRSPLSLLESLRDRAGRGARIYDWWSSHQGVYCALVRLAFLGRDRAARERALSALSLDAGDTVLDVGCGAGVNFDALATRVGPRGAVVALDYSEGMVRAAREHASNAPAPTTVIRGDATHLPFDASSFDAAYATLSLSAMGEPNTVIEAVYDSLRPGGSLAVVDARPFQDGPWSALNPLANPISIHATDWHPEEDVVGAIRRTFDESRTWTTNAGTLYVVSARKGSDR